MGKADEIERSKLTWREIPGWLAVIIALIGIFLTYREIRTANERQIVLRVWDDLYELDFSAGFGFPGVTPGSQADQELRLLMRIHAHAGLLDDRSLKEAANLVSVAWSKNYMENTHQTKSALSDAILGMTEVMEPKLGTYRPEAPSGP